MFLEGIALGGICGIIIGSIIAFTIGESSVEALRRLLDQRRRRQRAVFYESLYQ
jgi:hypothetical protein